MKTLNEDFTLDQLSPEDRDAFLDVPEKTLYTPGQLFYRFITPQKGAARELAGNAILDAKWWFDKETRLQLSRVAHRNKISLGSAARSRLAVTRSFNREMEYLCAIRLTAPVFGWVGRARWQEDADLKVCFPGGSVQVYFPSLATQRNGLASAVAKIESWAYLDDTP